MHKIYKTHIEVDLDIELVWMDGEADYVHLLVSHLPKLAISNLVNSLKGVSSRAFWSDRPDIAGRYLLQRCSVES